MLWSPTPSRWKIPGTHCFVVTVSIWSIMIIQKFINITPMLVIYSVNNTALAAPPVISHTHWCTRSHRQSHAAHPSLSYCFHILSLVQRNGTTCIMGIFQRYQLSGEGERASQRNSKGGRSRAWRTWELTEGVTDALDQKRRVEHVIGGSQASFTQNAVLCSTVTAGLPWLRRRLQQKRKGVEPTSEKLSLLTQLCLLLMSKPASNHTHKMSWAY